MPKERILVVDDEPDVLRVCERILVSDGYIVRTVGNGFEAVQLAGAEAFDLLLTDIKMPGMDGLDVAEAARTVNPHLVCVTMTGYSTMDTAIEALKLGIEEFIIKPFTPQDLIAAVSRALEKERLRRESGRLRALLPLFEANRVFMSTTDVDRLAHEVVGAAARELKADRALLLLASGPQNGNGASGDLRPTAGQNVDDAGAPHWQAIATLAVQSDRPLLFDQRQPHALLAAAGAASLLACTVNSKQGGVGVLIAVHDDPGRSFDEGDREFLNVLCGQAGIAIENASLFGELRRAYEELKQLDYMKSEFISIAAHELRTPLAILMGYAGILEGMVPSDVKQYATIILRNAGRLRALMDEMLNLDALERGASLVRFEAMSLGEVVSEIVDDLRPLADNRRQRLELTLPTGEVRLTTDREKFGMVLANLLGNAIKFTGEGGTIAVRAGSHPDGVLVEVEDSGVGIAEGEWGRIFDRFYQVEDSLTREHEGMGLGLSIAKGMVELLGGHIWVESVVGRGSTFRFTVPLTPRA
ncbi:MAG: hybrid sensor histidine kinase/response regulator [Anaerolineae bacterium]